MDWTKYFLNIAETVKLKSKDESTQIGSVIVGQDHEILSTGYNSFPRGLCDDNPKRQERPEKYDWMVHSELNAILNASRVGVSVKNGTLYLTAGTPCCECAKAIINAGITTVYCKEDCTTTNREKWSPNQEKALKMLIECDVTVNYY